MKNRKFKRELRRIPWFLVAVFLLMTAGIITTGYFYFGEQKAKMVLDTYQSLELITELKASELETWRKERLYDAKTIFKNPTIPKLVEKWFTGNGHDTELKTELIDWMKAVRNIRDYEGIYILDTNGNVRLSNTDSETRLDEEEKNLAKHALQTKEITFSDFYKERENNGEICIASMIPLIEHGEMHSTVVGIVFLKIHAEHFLYPFIQTWPTKSLSAETLLVKRDGDKVLYLNELRHRKDTALSLKLPATSGQLPAAMAVRGIEGNVDGVDYRGIPVFATIHKIPDTPWYLITKIDKAEVYSPIHERQIVVIALAILSIIATAFLIIVFWRRKFEKFYKSANESYEILVKERTFELEKEIEDRKEIEKKLRAADTYNRSLIEASVDPLVTIGPDGKITDVNAATEKATGLSRKELVGTDFSDYFTDPDTARKGYQKVFREGLVRDYELEIRHKDGSTTPVLYNATVYLDATGKVIGVFAAARDIKQQKLAEKELLRTQAELSSTRRLSDIGALAATVAHELRNPLGVIQAAVYNIRKKSKDSALEKHIMNIEEEIADSSQIINNLLFYTRMKKPNLENIIISDLLVECETTVANRFRGHKVDIVSELSPLANIKISVDPFQMKEVFNNILVNAYQALKDDKGTITVIARSNENRTIEISIKDDGEGIDENDMAMIFEPFFTRKSTGTGLGLAICRELLRLHNGEITIDSKKGEGTIVTVKLPIGG